MKSVVLFISTLMAMLLIAQAHAGAPDVPTLPQNPASNDTSLKQQVAYVFGTLLNQLQDSISFTSFTAGTVDLKDLDKSFTSGPLTFWEGDVQLNMRRYVNSLPRLIDGNPFYANDVFRLYYKGGPKLAASVLPFLTIGGGVQVSIGRSFSVIHPTQGLVSGFLERYWDRYKLPWESLDKDTLAQYFDKPEGYGFMVTDYVDITASVDIHAQLPQLSVFQMGLGNNMEVRRYWAGSRILYRDSKDTIKLIRERETGTAFDDAMTFNLGVGLGMTGPMIPINVQFLKVKREKSKIVRTVYHFNRSEIATPDSENALAYLLGRFTTPDSKIRAPDYQLETQANYEQIESSILGLTLFERKRAFERMQYTNADPSQDGFFLHAFSVRNVANSRRVSVDWKAILNENPEAKVDDSKNSVLQIHIERHPIQMRVRKFKKVASYFNLLADQPLLSCLPLGSDNRTLGAKYLSFDLQIEKDGIDEAMKLSDSELCHRISPESNDICEDPLLEKKSGVRGWFKHLQDGQAMQWQRIRKILSFFHELRDEPEADYVRKLVNAVESHARPERAAFMQMLFRAIRHDKRSNQILIAGGSDLPQDCNGVYAEGKPFAENPFLAIDEEAILLSQPLEFGIAHTERLGRPMREFFKFDM